MDTHHPAFEEIDGAIEAALEFHGQQLVDDLRARYGFRATRDMLARWLSPHAGNRPVVIDHIQEPRQ